MSEEKKPSNVNFNPSVRPFSPTKPPVSPNKNLKPNTKKVETEDINKNIKREDTTEDKKRKKKILIWILILLLLLVAIGIGVYLFLRIPRDEFRFKLYVESEVKTTIENSDGSLSDIEYFPGDTIEAKLNFQVVNEELRKYENKKVYLRFKINIEVDGNSYIDLFSPIFSREQDWIKGDDGYYYYKIVLDGDRKVHTAFETLSFDEEKNNNVLNGKTGSMIFTVEVLEANQSAISQYWQTAPSEWRKIVRG